MKPNFTRRDFLRVGAAAAATAANSRIFFASPLANSSANVFTIAVIADTQFYTDGSAHQPLNKSFFLAQTNYLAQNKDALNLAFVSHVGDMVEHGDGKPADFAKHGKQQDIEWQYATEAMDVLDNAGIPFGVAIGNHDYDNIAYKSTDHYPPLVSTASWWKKYFGSESKYFQGKSWYGGASENIGYTSSGEGGKHTGEYPSSGTACNYGLSSYHLFSAGGKKFLHIALELEANDHAIAWAQDVLDSYPGYATIVTTHSFISPPGNSDDNKPLETSDPARYNSAAWLVGSPLGYNDPENIWTKLIRPNNQIFLVLCGHAFGDPHSVHTSSGEKHDVSNAENIRIDKNEAGNPVYQVLTDYQGNSTLGSAGGDGWYRFMQFDLDSNKIHFYTVNAYKSIQSGEQVLAGQKTLYSDHTSDFDQPKGFSDFTLDLPEQVLNADNA